MKRRKIITWLSVISAVVAAGCGLTSRPVAASQAGERALVIHDFRNGLAGVHATNPALELNVDRDSGVLVIAYPAASADPAARDVYFDVENRDWSAGRAIRIRVNPSRAIRLSLSFVDNNGVVYTSWLQLRGGSWQSVTIPFIDLRPNPYFQPPNAKQGSPLDVSRVDRFGLAPQDPAPGELLVSQLEVVKT